MPDTYPFHKLLPILPNDTLRESDLAKANILIHLLCVFRVERTPTTTHLKEQHPQGPKIYKFGVTMIV
jgi:hypothetical protein